METIYQYEIICTNDTYSEHMCIQLSVLETPIETGQKIINCVSSFKNLIFFWIKSLMNLEQIFNPESSGHFGRFLRVFLA